MFNFCLPPPGSVHFQREVFAFFANRYIRVRKWREYCRALGKISGDLYVRERSSLLEHKLSITQGRDSAFVKPILQRELPARARVIPTDQLYTRHFYTEFVHIVINALQCAGIARGKFNVSHGGTAHRGALRTANQTHRKGEIPSRTYTGGRLGISIPRRVKKKRQLLHLRYHSRCLITIARAAASDSQIQQGNSLYKFSGRFSATSYEHERNELGIAVSRLGESYTLRDVLFDVRKDAPRSNGNTVI